jgi:hypothetical protein
MARGADWRPFLTYRKGRAASGMSSTVACCVRRATPSECPSFTEPPFAASPTFPGYHGLLAGGGA